MAIRQCFLAVFEGRVIQDQTSSRQNLYVPFVMEEGYFDVLPLPCILQTLGYFLGRKLADTLNCFSISCYSWLPDLGSTMAATNLD